MNCHAANCYCRNHGGEDFVKWVIEVLGPVLLGAKPAEILSFPERKGCGIEEINRIKMLIDTSNKICYNEFSYCNKCHKIFFYNVETLDRTLRDKRNLKFLKQRGYPEDYALSAYMAHLTDQMKQGIIPDEIGIFLGYPLKDVMGFIGHPVLKLTKVKGWRVYGDPRLSDKVYGEFLNARSKIKEILNTVSLQNIFMSIYIYRSR